MRKLLLSIILVCVLIVPALAHPGGTDSSGGHYDHSTGEYHYHHGYGPHDHEDLDGDGDLDCPYKFKDKTGESSGESSGSVTRYPTATQPKSPAKPKQPTESKPDYLGMVVGVFFCALELYGFVWLPLKDWLDHRRR